jgi:class I fructose-bisphosphate aldolase
VRQHKGEDTVTESLFDRDLGVGKRARLRRLFPRGPALVLRVDQGLEQGPGLFAPRPESADPAVALHLAQDSGYSGVILPVGLAEHAFAPLAGLVPLVLKLNGKTAIPPDDEALAPLTATVEDALRLGADAVAYSFYAGTPAQFEDLTQIAHVRQEAARYGMPLLMLAEPRGAAVERKGGPNSLYALEYAARAAADLGADLVALAAPVANPQRDAQAPKPYNTLRIGEDEALRRVLSATGAVPAIALQDGAGPVETVLAQATAALDAGARGVILGLGAWQRPDAEARDLADRLRSGLEAYVRR